ncbi:MAG: UvrD-helicase domain-containing protein [Bacillota bacterium]|nr:UvrD-helicase domain-containing protein [Bacillota bacterium]
MTLTWTDEQREAIGCAGSAAVGAAAGSGKTAVLVARFLHLLDRGLEPEAIAAVTFTERAGAELRMRLRQELLGRDDARSRRLAERFAERAWVGTIHSLAARLLRQAPLEAGLVPGFRVLDEDEASILRRKAATEAVHAAVAGDPEVAAVVAELGLDRSVEWLLEAMALLRRDRVAPGEAGRLTLATLEGRRQALEGTVARLLGTVEALLAAPRRSLAAGTRRRLDELQELAPGLDRLAERLAALEPEAELALRRLARIASGSTAQAVQPRMAELRALLAELDGLLGDLRWLARAPGFLRALEAVDRAYDRAKAEREAVDFDDLVARALELLERRAARGAPPPFRAVLVDEFQDTDRLQWSLFRLLAGWPENGQLYLVGDPKQSIYRFRGADVRVFATASRALAQAGGHRLALPHNFRSEPRLIAFVNRLFRRLLPAEGDVVFEPSRSARPRAAEGGEVGAAGGSEPRLLFVLLEPAPEPLTQEERSRREARYWTEAIRRVVEAGRPRVPDPELPADGDRPGERPPRYGDFAVLARALGDLLPWQEALREAGVPFVVGAGRGYFQREEVRDLLRLVRWLRAPADEMALAALLRSPFFAVSDAGVTWLVRARDRLREQGQPGATLWHALEPGTVLRDPGLDEADRQGLAEAQRRLGAWLEELPRRPLSALLEAALVESGYLATFEVFPDRERRLANVEAFLARVAGLEARGLVTPEEVAAELEALLEMDRQGEPAPPSEAADAVHLLTVHAAKGLEFPWVILPRLERSLLGRNRSLPLFRRELGLALPLEGASGEATLYGRLKAEERAAAVEEEKRLLYVALTRAREYLWLSAAPSGRGSAPDTARAPEAMQSWLEWLWWALELGAGDPLPVERRLEDPESGETAVVTIRKLAPDDLSRLLRQEGRPASAGSAPPPQAPAQPAARPLPAPPPERPEADRPLPATALNTWRRCPRLFYYVHVRHWPEPAEAAEAAQTRPGAPGRDGPAPAGLAAGEAGTLVHAVLEALPAAGPARRGATGEAPGFPLAGLIRRQAVRLGLEEARVELSLPRLEAELRRYLASPGFREQAEAERAGRLWRELPLAVEVEGWLLTGRLDRAWLDGEGRLVVLDFKTDRLRPGEEEEAVDRYLYQMAAYAQMAPPVFRAPLERVELAWLATGGRSFLAAGSPGLLRAVEELRQVLARLHAARTAEDYPGRAAACPACGFRRVCPAAARRSS